MHQHQNIWKYYQSLALVLREPDENGSSQFYFFSILMFHHQIKPNMITWQMSCFIKFVID